MEFGLQRERGFFRFETHEDWRLVANSSNVEKHRALWLDRTLESDESLGPADTGDFDHGAWHIACQLVAANVILRSSTPNTSGFGTIRSSAAKKIASPIVRESTRAARRRSIGPSGPPISRRSASNQQLRGDPSVLRLPSAAIGRPMIWLPSRAQILLETRIRNPPL